MSEQSGKNESYVHSLLQEAFDALTPLKSGGSDEAERIAEVRAKIAGYLATHAGLTLPPSGGGGGPATFGDASTSVIATRGGSAGSGSRVDLHGVVIGSVWCGPGGGGHAGQSLGAAGVNGFGSSLDFARERAKEYGAPVCYAGGGGGGMESFKEWIFPDGHTERLPAGEPPKWPKSNPLRDALLNNRD